MDAAVRAEPVPVLVDDGSGARDRRLFPLDEHRVIAIRNEADLLTVGLLGHGQAETTCLSAYLGLGKRPNREHSTRELILCQRKEEVGLILLGIRAALQQPSPVHIALHTSVMAGRDVLGAEASSALQERRELQIAVAMRTRQRRPARCVLLNEVRDDGLAELALEIDDVVRKTDRRGDAARVVKIIKRAAAAPRLLAAALIVELHRQTDNVVTLLREQSRGD